MSKTISTVSVEVDAIITDEQYKECMGLLQEANERMDGLKRENAKLRELVRDYDRVLDAAVDVWGIMADVLGYGSKYDALHDRMRELGVEVEE